MASNLLEITLQQLVLSCFRGLFFLKVAKLLHLLSKESLELTENSPRTRCLVFAAFNAPLFESGELPLAHQPEIPNF